NRKNTKQTIGTIFVNTSFFKPMKLQSEVKQKGILAVRIMIKTKSIAKDRMYRPTLLYVFLCINTPYPTNVL
ncbi:TPA: hypothetical protein ACQ8QN_004566, partial [Escherichia coli]